LQHGENVEGMLEDVVELGVTIEPFTSSHAHASAQLWAETRHSGLSLADRACLSLAEERSLPALTADQAWGSLTLDVRIELIR